MFVGRHERVLAIDGDYIHIMPSETRTMFESMKTVYKNYFSKYYL
jgi:target of rapamycin complex 2 subunit MAPKAP1